MNSLPSLAVLVSCGVLGCAHTPSVPVRHVVSSADAPAFLLPGGKGTARLLVNAETGASAASLGILELQAGAGVPEHVHEHSVEMLYVEEGHVEMSIEGRALSVQPGDAVYIPAGVRHLARVPEGAPRFRAVQIYVGPGPEQRFRQGEPVKAAVSPE
ncbi:Cupin domain-containing protein [Stigmatella aurantiaca]|uniref:Cupin domain-containing protein n=1 Tax=Stigmatella aurantiaca TaxID=41 RepID=A0A1H8C3E9_STIAU|nr:cupin domain-containing protein [Stigmatella aurantiaca]SEM88974.1 Cupin domain-containing protein [Stigmatella aurantiaca]